MAVFPLDCLDIRGLCFLYAEQETGLEVLRMDLLYVKDSKLVSYRPTDDLREDMIFTVTNA